MVEKKFVLSSASELQRIGLRAQIVSFLISEGVKEGNALNDLQDKNKVIVAVRQDYEKQIEQVKKDLVAYLNRLNESDPVSYGHFPKDIQASGLMELNNPHPIKVLTLTDLADSLMLEQTSKGVGAMLSVGTAITGIGVAINSLTSAIAPLKALPAAIDRLEKKLQK